jgi:hypothetical protein
LTQSENAAILLNTSPEEAAKMVQGWRYAGDLVFILVTDEKIQQGLAAGCKLFSSLGKPYGQKHADPSTSQLFLVAEITGKTISFDYVRDTTFANVEEISDRVRFKHYFHLLAPQGTYITRLKVAMQRFLLSNICPISP